MAEENNVQTNAAAQEQASQVNPHMSGPWINRRFILYDKIKLSLKAMDIIIAVCAVLLVVTLILGMYKH